MLKEQAPILSWFLVFKLAFRKELICVLAFPLFISLLLYIYNASNH